MSKINYDRNRERRRCRNGVSHLPLYNSYLPMASVKQIDYVRTIVRQLEQLGIEVPMRLKEDPPFTANGINNALRELRELMSKNGIEKIVPEFVNICRDKETGGKLRYRTSKRYHAPVGYEFLYELRTEFKCIRADNS